MRSRMRVHTHASTRLGGRGFPGTRTALLQPRARGYLARRTLGPVQRGPLLGLAEVRVVRLAAPQLLAGLEALELRGKGTGVVSRTGPQALTSCSGASDGEGPCGGRWGQNAGKEAGGPTPSNWTPLQVPWPPATPLLSSGAPRRGGPLPTSLVVPPGLPLCLCRSHCATGQGLGFRVWGALGRLGPADAP